ncbi:hypothetical protein SEA_WOLLYPOG_69 [Arthrobacter phage Wollypog]|uniref:Uncharacterized protein n=1 Tax=Arthrobacter phage Wollypog TaxID=2790985 RepID=A0A7T3KCF8_9CAUD|nr:hypothetical protein PP291_gp69 [Arthrobacter phage Wollypog]QPX62619.1 hypothetical protein SEA_WOLLYPOG_69 [Arthrobacter phage Wollypog]
MTDHNPCCSAHGVDMDCERYRRTHFVEVRPCCSADARRLSAEQDEKLCPGCGAVMRLHSAIAGCPPQNIQKLERESGSRKVRYLLDPRYTCCDSPMKEGHDLQCEKYPMEAP